MLLASFLFLPFNVKADTSSSPYVAIKTSLGGFIEPNKSYTIPEEVTICVAGFDVPNDTSKYSVEYYYYKQSTNDVMYKEFGVVEYKDEDGKRNFELKYNFFSVAGSGIYNIKAVILQDDKVFAFPNDFELTLKPPVVETKDTKIVMNNLGVMGGSEYPKYHLKVQVYKDKDKEIFEDISKCQIDWFYWLNNQKHYIGAGEDIYWTPSQNGDYKIEAVIDMGTSDGIVIATTDTVWIAKNYSFYAIIALAGVAVVLTAIVIVTTVRKIKKERVW